VNSSPQTPRARAFYENVFGWRFTRAAGSPIEYWRIDTNGIRGSLLARPAPPPPAGAGTNAFTCSVEINDFDARAVVNLAQGGGTALRKFAVPGVCWQGYFLDSERR
jgi:hypothetical protein